MGGLGNQLFQIFVAMAHALRRGQPFTFSNCATLTVGAERPTYWETLLKGLKPFLRDRSLIQLPTYREPHMESGLIYTPLPPGDNMMLLGYFQSPKYFEREYDIIMKILDIEKQRVSVAAELSELLINDPVSIHFRINDYISMQDAHPLCTIDYYRQAIERMECVDGVSTPRHYLIFCQSSDVEAVRQHLQELGLEKRYTMVPPELEDWKALLLMASCSDHIIANSTFSWWAAYFHYRQAAPMVVYPRKWLGPAAGGAPPPDDLIPLNSGWIGF